MFFHPFEKTPTKEIQAEVQKLARKWEREDNDPESIETYKFLALLLELRKREDSTAIEEVVTGLLKLLEGARIGIMSSLMSGVESHSGDGVQMAGAQLVLYETMVEPLKATIEEIRAAEKKRLIKE